MKIFINNSSLFSTLLLLLSLFFVVVEAQDDNNCIDSLNTIAEMERVADTSVNRIYILCPNTSYYPGPLNAQGSGFVDDQFPLLLRSRATVQCGEDGSSDNECIIEGSGNFGALIGPSYFPGDTTSINVKLIGLTFREFIDEFGQSLVISYRTPLGRLLIEDCVFDYLQMKQNLEFTQILVDDDQFEFEGNGRYLTEEGEEEEDVPTIIQSKKEFHSKYSKEEISNIRNDIKQHFNKEMFDEIFKRKNNDNKAAATTTTTTTNNDDEGRALATTTGKRRNLQRGRRFNVVIKRCVFRDVFYPFVPINQRSLSLLHFSAVDPNNVFDNVIDDTTMNVQILQTRFNIIDESYANDVETVPRSVIDFFSGGRLTLTDICFRGVDQSTNGPSTFILSNVQSNVVMDPKTIYIDPDDTIYGPDSGPICPLLTFVKAMNLNGQNTLGYDSCYELEDGLASTAEQCFDEPPPPIEIPAGAGLFGCFTSNNYVQILKGNNNEERRVRMDRLKLGDRVLVSKDDNNNNKKYEEVYSFAHYHPTQRVAKDLFIRLLPSKIELSTQHLIYLEGKNSPIPAGTLQIGDVLASGQVVTGKEYTLQKRKGIYAPLTSSGTIIVNDELVSTFIALQDNTSEFHILGFNTGLSHHWLSHIFEYITYHCMHKGKGEGDETYTSDGISTRLSGLPFQFYRWLNTTTDNNNTTTSTVLTTAVAVLTVVMLLRSTSIHSKKKI